jgi:DNA-binding transcriptional ArsR family regulator
MVQYATIDRALGAISDPTRRQILDQLARGPASISQLAQPFGMSLTGMKKHVQILEEARLVVTEKVGRTRSCRLGPERLDEVFDWIGFYRKQWDHRLDGLEAYFEEKKGTKR